MKFGSLFSGIGGFDLGFERAGMECAWQCEIDKHAQNVLRTHFGKEIYNDVRTIGRDTEPVDLICGGFPCQDVSIAGRRAGLAGERSGLWFEFARIVKELKPGWVVIENVPGLLSSNGGRDFAVILQELVKFGYGVCWRILDAQFFGVPQRRRRVFIVASLGNGRAAKVLFESEGLRGNPPTRSQAGERVADSLTVGANQYSGFPGEPVEIFTPSSIAGYSEGLGTLRANGGDIGGGSEMFIARSLTSSNQRQDFETENFVTAYNVNFCDTGGTRKDRPNGGLYINETDKSNTLASGGNNTLLAPSVGVRRLTPTECERLQGFPDGWTEGQADTQRYKQLGNAVAVPVIEWIGRRIVKEYENQ